MPNKCAVFSCKSNYYGGPKNHVVSFPDDEYLRQKWIQFVNRNDWKWSKHSVICINHFEEEYIIRYKKKVLLDRKANYCPLVWHFTSSNSIKMIEKVQERLLRFLYTVIWARKYGLQLNLLA